MLTEYTILNPNYATLIAIVNPNLTFSHQPPKSRGLKISMCKFALQHKFLLLPHEIITAASVDLTLS